MRSFKLPRRLNVFTCALLVTVFLMAVSAFVNVAWPKEHRDYTDCAVMGDLFYKLAVYRLQGYPIDLATNSIKAWKMTDEWKRRYISVVRWLYAQGAPPKIAMAEAIAYCKTGELPVITRPTKPPQPPPKAGDKSVKNYLLTAPQVFACT